MSDYFWCKGGQISQVSRWRSTVRNPRLPVGREFRCTATVLWSPWMYLNAACTLVCTCSWSKGILMCFSWHLLVSTAYMYQEWQGNLVGTQKKWEPSHRMKTRTLGKALMCQIWQNPQLPLGFYLHLIHGCAITLYLSQKDYLYGSDSELCRWQGSSRRSTDTH